MKNKDQKEREHIVSKPRAGVNVFRQIMEDQIRIEQAIREGRPLSSLEGITFYNPLEDHTRSINQHL